MVRRLMERGDEAVDVDADVDTVNAVVVVAAVHGLASTVGSWDTSSIIAASSLPAGPGKLDRTGSSGQTNIALKTADNGELQVDCFVSFRFEINGSIYTWNAFVAPITDDVLIGYDFLYHFNCVLEARRGLTIDGRFVECEFVGEIPPISRVKLSRDITVTVPARSELIASGHVEDCYFMANGFMVEPLPSGMRNDSLLVGAVVVQSVQASSGLPVRLYTSCEEITLNANTVIGIAQEITEITLIDASENNFNPGACASTCARVCNTHINHVNSIPTSTHERTASAELHSSLHELYQRSSKGLNDEQSDQLRNLLIKHQANFAYSSSDLGRTSVLQHEIRTGQAKPIRQPARRPPRSFEGEEEKIIEEQLKAGVIRPSSSPWASPIVYVKKKDGTIRPCVDYRKLNAVTEFDSFPLPRTDDCFDCLGGSKYFSTLDLQSGSWQVEVRNLIAKKLHFGHVAAILNTM